MNSRPVFERDGNGPIRAASLRSDRFAVADEKAALLARIERLENELRRARRCLAAERLGRDRVSQELRDEVRGNAYVVGLLCRIAFPQDNAPTQPTPTEGNES